MLIPLVSTAVVLTLAILGSVGPRVDWPHIRHESTASRAWSAWGSAGGATPLHRCGGRRPAPGPVGVTGLRHQGRQARSSSLASGGPAIETLHALRDGGVAAAVIIPLEVLVGGRNPAGSARQVVERLDRVDGVAFALAPNDASWRKAGTAAVGRARRGAGRHRARNIVKRMRSALVGVPEAVSVAGPGATVLDYSKAVFGHFPLVIGLIVLVTFVLPVRAFRSLLLPLKAVLLNVLSVAATFGFVCCSGSTGIGPAPCSASPRPAP